MDSSRKFLIDKIGERLVKALETLGWEVSLETEGAYYFKNYFASKRPGILEAFVFIEILLYVFEESNFMDLIFIFMLIRILLEKGRLKCHLVKKQGQMMQQFLEISARKFLSLQILRWSLIVGK